ncbi:head maturation protease, ClpP-related [Vitreoscilla sp. C1]|uniref:head maturation protease, ClpP-related n=1 Tax=Vitreoscilla sp. (strain C1) TaxID=96942 RepID=UPI001F3D74A2|nr:head maturation protease, ClpP-related [Vitreoscilla sp. C1]
MPLPQINTFGNLPKPVAFDKRPDAVQKWQPEVKAKSDNDSNTITIYDDIGESWYSEGVTANRIAAALRSIGEQDVVVNINSPGGDYFEGISIYNLLAQHRAKVTVQIVGLAASAASVIAMAGDEILMGDGAFFMIHNAWSMSIGNRHDLRSSADVLGQIDDTMADLYAKRSGLSKAEIEGMMDRESWLGRELALNNGFATGSLESSIIEGSEDSERKKSKALVDAAMAQQGLTRSQRREVFQSLFSGMPSAANPTAKPSAGDADVVNQIQELNNLFKGY